jgi:hypothetical protein
VSGGFDHPLGRMAATAKGLAPSPACGVETSEARSWRVGVGVLPRFTLVVWKEFPPPASHHSMRHSRSFASAFSSKNGREGGLCSPASGRGAASPRTGRFNQKSSRSSHHCRGFPTRRRIGNRTAKSVYITQSGAESGGDSSPMIPLKPQDDPEPVAASISSQC